MPAKDEPKDAKPADPKVTPKDDPKPAGIHVGGPVDPEKVAGALHRAFDSLLSPDEPAATGAPPLSPPRCPHCDGDLQPHASTSGPKVGASHCDHCGCCFATDGKVRDGHGSCKAED